MFIHELDGMGWEWGVESWCRKKEERERGLRSAERDKEEGPAEWFRGTIFEGGLRSQSR